jgi:hypothetical protein
MEGKTISQGLHEMHISGGTYARRLTDPAKAV